MKEILFLAHRIPYPPDKGDKIRSWNLLLGLTRHFRVHLGTFVDDPYDWRHVDSLRNVCDQVFVRPLRSSTARLRSLTGIASGRALTAGYYRDRKLASWVNRLAGERMLAGVFAFSSSMAQYAARMPLPAGARRIVDLCDVDSDKWRQYASVARWPESWVYRREARLLAGVEASCVGDFDVTLVIAEPEAAILREIAHTRRGRIEILPNGVDTGIFDPDLGHADPFPAGANAIVFTGAMDYLPNVDGVIWFAREVLPRIRRRAPRAHFWIVGSNPAPAVRELEAVDGVTVTGRVPDVRPYLAHSSLVVAPLRIARGVQNKVLEGLSMARTVVATPNAIQGIEGVTERELHIAETADEFVASIVGILERVGSSRNEAARDFVRRHFAWRARQDMVAGLMQPGVAGSSCRPAGSRPVAAQAARADC
jgi:sugar transferase (PEP-CTERM/EpsH1 system associated)